MECWSALTLGLEEKGEGNRKAEEDEKEEDEEEDEEEEDEKAIRR